MSQWASYVSTRPVDLSIIIRVKVDDLLHIVRYQSNLTAGCDLDTVVCRSTWTYVHGTAAVVLDNLVARLVCATADNPGFLASLVSFLWI